MLARPTLRSTSSHALIIGLLFAFLALRVVANAGRTNLASVILHDAVLGGSLRPMILATARPLEKVIRPPSQEANPERRRRRLLALGLLLESQGKSDQATSVWKAAESERFWMDLSGWAWRQGRPSDSISLCERAIAIAPDHIDNYLTLAWYFSPGSGRTTEGIATYRRAASVAAAGSFFRALAEGRAYELEQNWRSAYDAYGKAVTLNPFRGDVRRWLAASATKIGKPIEAIAQLTHAKRLTPTDSYLMIELGNAYREVGDLQQASQMYSESTRLDAANRYAHLGHASLGEIYLAKKMYELAEAEFCLAVLQSPATAAYYVRLGEVLEREGKKQRASEVYHRAAQLNSAAAAESAARSPFCQYQ